MGHSGAKLIISQADSYDAYAVNKKVQDNTLGNKQLQPDASNQAVVHIKEDLMSLFPDFFSGLGKFQGEPYHIVM